MIATETETAGDVRDGREPGETGREFAARILAILAGEEPDPLGAAILALRD